MAKDEGEASPGQPGELKVTDRRLFTADGQLREAVAEREAEEEKMPPRRETSTASEPGFERRPVEEPSEVDFAMLVNSMAELALLFLGEIPHPASGEPTIDLRRARFQIDMLDLLRVKTRGNLAPDEETLLEHVLYELRMRYLHRSNQAPR